MTTPSLSSCKGQNQLHKQDLRQRLTWTAHWSQELPTLGPNSVVLSTLKRLVYICRTTQTSLSCLLKELGARWRKRNLSRTSSNIPSYQENAAVISSLLVAVIHNLHWSWHWMLGLLALVQPHALSKLLVLEQIHWTSFALFSFSKNVWMFCKCSSQVWL